MLAASAARSSCSSAQPWRPSAVPRSPQRPTATQHHRSKRFIRPSANASGLLAKLFVRQSPEAAAAAAARQQLLEQLSSGRPEKAAISEACDALMAAQVPFRELDLGGGPWQVVYTRGPLLWQGPLAPRGGRVAGPAGNKASQDFDPRTKRVVNRGELLGPLVAVTASGSYEAADASTTCPKLVTASIEGGSLQAWGAEVPLPIRGSGLVYVAYLDRSLRIFRASNGSISVQVRQSELPQLLGWTL